jgi:hypothetical protein
MAAKSHFQPFPSSRLQSERTVAFRRKLPPLGWPLLRRIPAFRRSTTYLAVTRIEPDLSLTVTGLTVTAFNLVVNLRVFNTERMNAAVFAFRRYEDASLRYTGIDSHDGLTHIGGYDTVISIDA